MPRPPLLDVPAPAAVDEPDEPPNNPAAGAPDEDAWLPNKPPIAGPPNGLLDAPAGGLKGLPEEAPADAPEEPLKSPPVAGAPKGLDAA